MADDPDTYSNVLEKTQDCDRRLDNSLDLSNQRLVPLWI